MADDNDEGTTRKDNHLKKKYEPAVDTSNSLERPSLTKRPRTPLSETDNDQSMSSGSSGPSPRGMSPGISSAGPSPRGMSPGNRSAGPSPRGMSPIHRSSAGPSPRGISPIHRSSAGPSPRRLTPSPVGFVPIKMDIDNQSRSNSPYQPTPRRSQRIVARTTSSLDNVDLWEESDSENEQINDGFDRVNGVLINPRKTFDFSELRKSKSPLTAARQKLSSRTCESAKLKATEKTRVLPELKKRNPKSVMAVPQKPHLSDHPRESSVNVKPRVRVPPTMKSLFNEKQHTNLKSKIKADRSIQKAISPGKFPGFNNTYMSSHQDNSNLRDLTRNTKQSEAGMTCDKSHTPEYIERRRRSSVMDCDITDPTKETTLPVHVDSDSHADRRVKFNNFVTVREGNMSTLDVLRHSNNSAQMIKQRYLGRKELSTTMSTMTTQDESWQVVY